MNYIILRTDFRKEAYVASQIARLGFDAWVPVQVIAARPSIARRVTSSKQLRAYREICLLPRRVFCAVPVALEADLLKIRHAVAVERDAAQTPLLIPHAQLAAFRSEIDRENTAALALATRANSRKQKTRWKSLHDALLELIEGARHQLEAAA